MRNFNKDKLKSVGVKALLKALPGMNAAGLDVLEKQIQEESQIMLDLIQQERERRKP